MLGSVAGISVKGILPFVIPSVLLQVGLIGVGLTMAVSTYVRDSKVHRSTVKDFVNKAGE
jgi:hypothetical protein